MRTAKCNFITFSQPVCPNAQKTQIFHKVNNGFQRLALQYTTKSKNTTKSRFKDLNTQIWETQFNDKGNDYVTCMQHSA